MQTSVEIAGIQQVCGEHPEANLAHTESRVREAVASGAELVVLQELHRSRYFCQTESPDVFDLAEPIPGPTSERLGALAAELRIVLVASIFERRAAGLHHNTAVVFDRSDAIAGCYRKMHIPHDPGYCEKYYFAPGDLGFQPIPTSVGKLGVLVCWDQWFPEAARLMALAGADLLVYPTAIGYEPSDTDVEKARQRDAWITIQRSHAIANGLPVVVVNRVGNEPDPSGEGAGIDFWGHSFVAGPFGEILAQCPEEPDTLRATIDFAESERSRRIWPFLRDRRIDAYTGLTNRYG